eukprot:1815773-Alexandrium_andersonii.AAC.1
MSGGWQAPPPPPKRSRAAQEGPQRRVCSASNRFHQGPAVSSCFEQCPVLPLREGYRPPDPPEKHLQRPAPEALFEG